MEKLKQREDLLAIGIAGSIAYGDPWPGSDLDIEVVLRGDRPKEIVTTEQEISVDYGYFGESNLKEVPYDTRPIYDPTGLLTRELASRDRQEVIEHEISEAVNESQDLLRRGETALRTDPYSALVFIHLTTWRLNYALTLAAGGNRTIRRAVSRLDGALAKIRRQDLLADYGTLLGFPTTLERAGELLTELQQGYREVWGYFKGKPLGPVYMLLQPDSEAWFHNRIRPVYEYDRRDLVWLVYEEFPFVLYYFFRLAGHERTPINVFEEAGKFEGPPSLWSGRYRRVLGFFPAEKISLLIETGNRLLDEVKDLSAARLWAKHEVAKTQGH